ncbi:MAG TPA: hypothetical protein VMW49_08180 [Candidatus Dormibacteraeota bacterium]|nr:hypothetical protein [Candidatus Dormibacteraeota bacterium]
MTAATDDWGFFRACARVLAEPPEAADRCAGPGGACVPAAGHRWQHRTGSTAPPFAPGGIARPPSLPHRRTAGLGSSTTTAMSLPQSCEQDWRD